jgi:hypothetical protein
MSGRLQLHGHRHPLGQDEAPEVVGHFAQELPDAAIDVVLGFGFGGARSQVMRDVRANGMPAVTRWNLGTGAGAEGRRADMVRETDAFQRAQGLGDGA